MFSGAFDFRRPHRGFATGRKTSCVSNFTCCLRLRSYSWESAPARRMRRAISTCSSPLRRPTRPPGSSRRGRSSPWSRPIRRPRRWPMAGDRILAVGSLEEVKKALADRPFSLDERFAGKVLMPGLIEQHLHPILGALCLSVEVIAIEDWELPGRTIKAAANPRRVLRAGSARHTRRSRTPRNSSSPGVTTSSGTAHFRARTSTPSATTRPIVVWHRSAHEFYAEHHRARGAGHHQGVRWRGKDRRAASATGRKGHFYEKGLELITGRLLPRMATPERLRSGLEMLVKYLHGSGVTTINEPGAIVTPELLALYQSILGAESTPFSSLFIPDGRSLFERYGEDEAIAATEKVVALAPSGKVAFLPNQIKLFADGAIVSQLMQMKGGYTDGHKGRVDRHAPGDPCGDQALLGCRLPDSHPRQRRPRPRRRARRSRAVHAREPAVRPPHGRSFTSPTRPRSRSPGSPGWGPS